MTGDRIIAVLICKIAKQNENENKKEKKKGKIKRKKKPLEQK